jgi:tellurite resistance protein TerC
MFGQAPTWAWIALGVSIAVLLAIDLLAHRGGRGDSPKTAFIWTMVWVLAGLVFNAVVWITMDSEAGQQYLAAYLIEKSLSVDNLFVFLVIFASLNIPDESQRTVLSWGIFGALVFRALFVFLGVAALESAAWVSYVFGAILILAAIRAFREDPAEDKENSVVKFLSKHLPVTHEVHGHHFFVRIAGRRVATPLLVAIFAVELTDIVFAIDSVPAALAVSHDRFIVFSSNAFAILGLRALYILINKSLRRMAYLHYGLSAVLAFAGIKMMVAEWIEIPPYVSIGIISLLVGGSVWWSLRAGPDEKTGADSKAASERTKRSKTKGGRGRAATTTV